MAHAPVWVDGSACPPDATPEIARANYEPAVCRPKDAEGVSPATRLASVGADETVRTWDLSEPKN